MLGDGFFAFCISDALFFRWTFCTDVASAFVFSVSVSAVHGVVEHFVFWIDDAVIVAVVVYSYHGWPFCFSFALL